MNKEISHLTTERKTGTPTDKIWSISGPFSEIVVLMENFVAHASEKKLHKNVRDWVKADDKERLILVVDASTHSMNMAVVVPITAGPLTT